MATNILLNDPRAEDRKIRQINYSVKCCVCNLRIDALDCLSMFSHGCFDNQRLNELRYLNGFCLRYILDHAKDDDVVYFQYNPLNVLYCEENHASLNRFPPTQPVHGSIKFSLFRRLLPFIQFYRRKKKNPNVTIADKGKSSDVAKCNRSCNHDTNQCVIKHKKVGQRLRKRFEDLKKLPDISKEKKQQFFKKTQSVQKLNEVIHHCIDHINCKCMSVRANYPGNQNEIDDYNEEFTPSYGLGYKPTYNEEEYNFNYNSGFEYPHFPNFGENSNSNREKDNGHITNAGERCLENLRAENAKLEAELKEMKSRPVTNRKGEEILIDYDGHKFTNDELVTYIAKVQKELLDHNSAQNQELLANLEKKYQDEKTREKSEAEKEMQKLNELIKQATIERLRIEKSLQEKEDEFQKRLELIRKDRIEHIREDINIENAKKFELFELEMKQKLALNQKLLEQKDDHIKNDLENYKTRMSEIEEKYKKELSLKDENIQTVLQQQRVELENKYKEELRLKLESEQQLLDHKLKLEKDNIQSIVDNAVAQKKLEMEQLKVEEEQRLRDNLRVKLEEELKLHKEKENEIISNLRKELEIKDAFCRENSETRHQEFTIKLHEMNHRLALEKEERDNERRRLEIEEQDRKREKEIEIVRTYNEKKAEKLRLDGLWSEYKKGLKCKVYSFKYLDGTFPTEDGFDLVVDMIKEVKDVTEEITTEYRQSAIKKAMSHSVSGGFNAFFVSSNYSASFGSSWIEGTDVIYKDTRTESKIFKTALTFVAKVENIGDSRIAYFNQTEIEISGATLMKYNGERMIKANGADFFLNNETVIALQNKMQYMRELDWIDRVDKKNKGPKEITTAGFTGKSPFIELSLPIWRKMVLNNHQFITQGF